MSSWPALFAAAVAMWLILKGPAGKKPSWVQKTCRLDGVFPLLRLLVPLEMESILEVDAGVEEKRHREAAGFLNPGWFRRYRPLQDEPHRNRSSEQRRPRRHSALLSTTLTRSGGSAK